MTRNITPFVSMMIGATLQRLSNQMCCWGWASLLRRRQSMVALRKGFLLCIKYLAAMRDFGCIESLGQPSPSFHSRPSRCGSDRSKTCQRPPLRLYSVPSHHKSGRAARQSWPMLHLPPVCAFLLPDVRTFCCSTAPVYCQTIREHERRRYWWLVVLGQESIRLPSQNQHLIRKPLRVRERSHLLGQPYHSSWTVKRELGASKSGKLPPTTFRDAVQCLSNIRQKVLLKSSVTSGC